MKEVTIEFDLTENKDPTRQIVEGLIKQLESYRGTTSNPDDLEWEIRVYKYILESPEERWEQYSQARNWDKYISTRDAVKQLGWDVE
jgi:hypothetical protein